MPTKTTSGSEGLCPSCGKQPLEPRSIRDEFDYGADDERVRVVAEAVPVLVCPACKEVFYGPEAERVHHHAICKALGLLTPDQIRAVRNRLHMTQADFAELTGIGVATLSRWEQGRLMQTRSLDGYLRILAAVPDAIGVLNSLKDRPLSPMDPWRSVQVTAEIRSRQARFRLHPNGADPIDGSEKGAPTTPAAAESARS